MTVRPEDIRAGDVSFLPIVASYVKKLGIVDQVNRLCPTMSDVSAGQVVMALILDTLSGRSPLYKIEQSFVHHDTTSVTVYGDYDLYQDTNHSHPFVITRGFNKDHRRDLKQIVHSLLCVDRGVPVSAKLNGNESDKVINKNLLSEVSKKMRELGQDDPVYVGDSALVTEDNLELLADGEKGSIFFASA